MSARPRRRTLAERDAQAIQAPPETPSKETARPRGLGRGVLAPTKGNKGNNSTSATKSSKRSSKGKASGRRGAPPTGRVSMTIWIDRSLWGQAKTLYLRAHPGHETAMVEWVEEVVNDYLDALSRRAFISTPMGDDGHITTISITPRTRQRIIDTVEDHSLRGHGISRSAVIAAALRRAVAEAGGSSVPVYTGRLPRGRRPQP